MINRTARIPLAFFLLHLLLQAPGTSAAETQEDNGFLGGASREATANLIGGAADQAKVIAKKTFRASEMHQILATGNRAVRKESADALNQVPNYLKNEQVAKVIKGLGWGAVLADVGATVLGHASIGDFSGAGAVALNEAAKIAPSAGSAAGLGWAFASAGSFIGGPPGALIGGAIGAIVGGAAGSAAYNALVGDSLKKFAEYVLTGPITEKQQVWLDRIDYVEQKKAEEAMQALGWWEKDQSREFLIVGSSISRPKDFFNAHEEKPPTAPPETPKLIAVPPSDTVSAGFWGSSSPPPDQPREQPTVKEPPQTPTAETIPVIPESCTIDVEFWDPSSFSQKFKMTYYLDSGKASGTFSQTVAASNQCAAYEVVMEDTGILQDNRLIMEGKGGFTLKCTNTGTTSTKQGEQHVQVPYRCESELNWQAVSRSTLTLNIDHTLTLTGTTSGVSRYRSWGENCPTDDAAINRSYMEHNSGPQSFNLTGTWQIRD